MMRNCIYTIVLLCLLPLGVFAQQNRSDSGSDYLDQSDDNELRMNLLSSILGLPELNYERYLSANMGVGVSVAVSVEKMKNMSLRSMILPYYRIYFGDQKACGFFIEGNMALVGQKEPMYSYAYDSTGDYVNIQTGTRSATNFGFGAAVGFKLLTRGGVTGEVYLGAGRLFGNPIDGAYPRAGVCIGKRF